MPFNAGEKLGPYKIDALIGTGGMGEVYRAQDTRLHRTVAIKVVRPELALREEFSARLRREARAISALNHPHVCSLYDIGEEKGQHYLVMEFVNGESLDQILKRGPLPVDQVLRYGIEIADALKAAHTHGIIHRDLKPANIMISESGVKVLDFGLASQFEPEGKTGDTTVTNVAQTGGRMLGTVAYMSPEQAEGRPLDSRTDIFALGVTLYQMLCGRQPFRGESTLSTLASILREEPGTPRSIRTETPRELERIVLHCLAKKPEDRYKSADEVARDLEQLRKPAATITLRRPMVAALALVLLIVLGILGTRSYLQASRVRWSKTVAIPQASQLLEDSRPLAALQLLNSIDKSVPVSPELIRLKEDLAVLPYEITTTPPGAEIYATDYADPKAAELSHWAHLGRSPLKTDQLPRDGFVRLRIVKDGYAPVERTTTARRSLDVELQTKEDTPPGMVWIPQVQPQILKVMGVTVPSEEIPAAWLDRYEVTNRQYKEFVNARGYENPDFWKEPFIKDGKKLTFEEAMTFFRDAANRQGPSTWDGSYPEGEADLPVGGVSWYEAAAYAEFVQKSLPTLFHWYGAAGIGITSQIIPWSNFDSKGPMRGGETLGLGPNGNYDMAGNMKEWTMNSSREKRFILGGGWNEPSYMFQQGDARSPWDREPTFGFRTAFYPSPIPESLKGPVEKKERNRTNDRPVDDRTYNGFLETLKYNKKSDLDVSEEKVIDAPRWRRVDVSFRAAYGTDRVILHLYLPKDAVPPFQAIFYCAGNNMRFAGSPDQVFSRLPEWIVKSGRAVVLVAYDGTLERKKTPPPDGPDMERELGIHSFQDAARTIDYLGTRKDIDTSNIGFVGVSFGAGLGLKIVAAEPRFKATVLLSLGYTPDGGYGIVDSWNYAPRLKVPVLMISGEDDSMAPVRSSQLPMFKALGTPEPRKKRIPYPGGHVDFVDDRKVIDDTLDWLNTYLAPVNSKR